MENKIEILFPKEENNIELFDRCLINKYKLTGLHVEVLICMGFLKYIVPPHYYKEEQVGKLKREGKVKVKSPWSENGKKNLFPRKPGNYGFST